MAPLSTMPAIRYNSRLMTARVQEATSRLSEIWRDWGMKLPTDEAKSQRGALAALSAHLQMSDTARVRAVQALLVDPEQPGAHKRPLFTDFWNIVEESWATAGTDDQDLLFLQAMLLAVWPDDATWITPALVSPWAHFAGRGRQFKALIKWRDLLANERLDDNEPAPTDEDAKLDLTPFSVIATRLDSIPRLTKEQTRQIGQFDTALGRHIGNHSAFSISTNCVLKATEESIGEIVSELAKLAQITRVGLRTLEHASAHQPDPERHTKNSFRMQELLWWGQARYSHLAHQPFRRIDNPARALWLASREAAERAMDLPVEPSASYLQETLAAIGHDLAESRPLWDWLTDLRLAANHDPSGEFPTDLANLLDVDALGLPVSLLCHNPEVADEPLRNAIGVPSDTTLDLGDWAAWIFRELVFQHRWQETEQ